MPDTQAIPSIEVFVEGYTSESNPEKYLAKLMQETFLGNLTPLLLMTRPEFSWLSKFGKARTRFVVTRMGELGMQFRHPNQSVAARAIELCGNLDCVPVQALLLNTSRSRNNVVSVEYRSFDILRFIASYDSTISLGAFLGRDVEEELLSIIYDSNELIDKRRIEVGVNELTDRLAYWEAASS